MEMTKLPPSDGERIKNLEDGLATLKDNLECVVVDLEKRNIELSHLMEKVQSLQLTVRQVRDSVPTDKDR